MNATTGSVATERLTLKGTLTRAEERGPLEAAYGYARLRTVDRKTGRESEHTLIAEGTAFEQVRPSWYDGLRATVSVVAKGDELHLTQAELA